MSRCGHYAGYNDDWIIQNVSKYTSWKLLFEEYYKIFSFGNYTNFRNHLYNDLGMTRCFSAEQDAWLIENYPLLGAAEATKRFCETFNIGRSKQTIVVRANKLGIKVNEEVSNRLRKESNHLSLPIGKTVTRTNSYGNKTVWQKTENGWIRQSHLAMGEVPKGKIVVHCDGDYTNNGRENLCAISKGVNGRMVYNRFYSENPEITRAGILCCELEEALETKGELWKKQQE